MKVTTSKLAFLAIGYQFELNGAVSRYPLVGGPCLRWVRR